MHPDGDPRSGAARTFSHLRIGIVVECKGALAGNAALLAMRICSAVAVKNRAKWAFWKSGGAADPAICEK